MTKPGRVTRASNVPPPSGRVKKAFSRQTLTCRPAILSTCGIEKNRPGKVFLIIVNRLVVMASVREFERPSESRDQKPDIAATPRPSDPQRRYLERGLREAGGKLPLFDANGRLVPHKTIEACIAHGWAEPWVANPIKPDWLVCRLTQAGYRALGHGGPATLSRKGPAR